MNLKTIALTLIILAGTAGLAEDMIRAHRSVLVVLNDKGCVLHGFYVENDAKSIEIIVETYKGEQSCYPSGTHIKMHQQSGADQSPVKQ